MSERENTKEVIHGLTKALDLLSQVEVLLVDTSDIVDRTEVLYEGFRDEVGTIRILKRSLRSSLMLAVEELKHLPL